MLRVGTRPTELAWLVDRVERLADGHGAALTSSVGVGLHTLRLRGGDPCSHSALLTGLREELAQRNATCVVCRPDGLDAASATRGRPPAGVAVMRAIKNRFDPDGRFGAGRFAPWF